MEIEKESLERAARRMGMLIPDIEDRLGTEFVYAWSYSHGKMIIVKRGSAEDTGEAGLPPPAYLYLRRFLRFCVYGPDTVPEGLLWGVMCPVTLPIMVIGLFVVGIRELFSPVAGPVYVVDGGGSGDGFFDEVSTRRRDDYQFITGTGKYAKENW